MTDVAFNATLQEIWRLTHEHKEPNGTPLEHFGPYREMIESLHLAYTSQVEANEAYAKLKPELVRNPAEDVMQAWADWSAQFPELTFALQQAAASQAKPNTNDLKWLHAQLETIPAGKDGVELRTLLKPTLEQIIKLPDDVMVVAALEEMRRFFKWKRETLNAYRDLITKARRAKQRDERPEHLDVYPEGE